MTDSINRIIHNIPDLHDPTAKKESETPELKNALSQIEVSRTKQCPDTSDLDIAVATGNSQIFAGLSLAEIEHRALIEALIACSGNKASAARKLGISEKSIYNMMRRFKIQISPNKKSSNHKIGGLGN